MTATFARAAAMYSEQTTAGVPSRRRRSKIRDHRLRKPRHRLQNRFRRVTSRAAFTTASGSVSITSTGHLSSESQPFGVTNQLAICHGPQLPSACRTSATTGFGLPSPSNWKAGWRTRPCRVGLSLRFRSETGHTADPTRGSRWWRSAARQRRPGTRDRRRTRPDRPPAHRTRPRRGLSPFGERGEGVSWGAADRGRQRRPPPGFGAPSPGS